MLFLIKCKTNIGPENVNFHDEFSESVILFEGNNDSETSSTADQHNTVNTENSLMSPPSKE